MRIAVMGAGGMGGYFGGRLARAGEAVALIARGDHLRAIQDRGLTVRSVGGDFSVTVPATDDPRRVPDLIGPVDLVLFCVKSYDTEVAAEAIRPILGPEAAVLTVQNGVMNEETLADRLGAGRVLGGLVYGFAVIEAPGVIRHTYHDLTHGRPLELEALHGYAVRLGQRHGIETPALFAIYAALRPSALAAQSSR